VAARCRKHEQKQPPSFPQIIREIYFPWESPLQSYCLFNLFKEKHLWEMQCTFTPTQKDFSAFHNEQYAMHLFLRRAFLFEYRAKSKCLVTLEINQTQFCALVGVECQIHIYNKLLYLMCIVHLAMQIHSCMT